MTCVPPSSSLPSPGVNTSPPLQVYQCSTAQRVVSYGPIGSSSSSLSEAHATVPIPLPSNDLPIALC